MPNSKNVPHIMNKMFFQTISIFHYVVEKKNDQDQYLLALSRDAERWLKSYCEENNIECVETPEYYYVLDEPTYIMLQLAFNKRKR